MSKGSWREVLMRHPYGSIILYFAVLYLLGNNLLPMTDPVESNYTETAGEMLASGDYFSPRIYGHYWYDKPAFFYWELLAAFSAFGMTDFAARFFPAVFSILALCLTYRFGTLLYDKGTGLRAAFILGTSAGYWYLSKAVITDMTLLVFFSLTLMTFYLGWCGNRRWYLASFAFAGFGVLTKGPIAFLLPGFVYLIFLCLRRRPAEILRIHWPLGMVIFLVIAGLWYGPMASIHGQAFIDTFLGTHNFLRASVPEHPETDVFYYYTAITLIFLLPWTFVLGYALKKKWRAIPWRHLPDGTLFLLAWAVTVTLFYQCMATKYPTYTLPSFLPAAILAARLLRDWPRLVRYVTLGWGAVLVVLTFSVALPQVEQASMAREAAMVHQARQGGEPIYYWGDYKASLVYYLGGQKVPNLRPEASIENMLPVPGESSWRDLNVMPFQAVEQLPAGTCIVVAAKKQSHRSPEVLTDYLPPEAELQLLGETAKSRIYRLTLPDYQ
ncbi:MAG: glycosyltransferase family 39 protein [Selenomonadaceae bacterium]|nr:glycosyltransferase family 39 protein [Selenomonadaceae bacterium]MDY3916000.1 glycosyltransferase family 39 protein [Selenomonadaceae bacterium]